MADDARGMRRGLANYGDAGFSLFLRKAFIKAMGYSDDALDRTIVGITNTFSGYNACHKNARHNSAGHNSAGHNSAGHNSAPHCRGHRRGP